MRLTEEQRKIIEKNHSLIYGYCKKYNLNIDEYYGDLAIGLCLAVQNYNNKYNLSTYVYNIFHNIIYNLQRNKKRHRPNNIISLEECKENEISNNDDNYDIFHAYKDILNEQDRQIIILLYYKYTQKEIAKILGKSQSQISQKIKKIKLKIKNNIITERKE